MDKSIRELNEEIDALKRQCDILKKDNEILQKDYYNQIIINEFIKLDEYIDDINDLFTNLFSTIEKLVDVDMIGISLFETQNTNFAFFKRVPKVTEKKLKKNYKSILQEYNTEASVFTEKNSLVNDVDIKHVDLDVYSTIIHKITRHGKVHGIIVFYMFNNIGMSEKSKLIKLFMSHISTLIENALLFEGKKNSEEELKKKLSAFETLYKLSQVHGSTKKLDTVLRKILKAMVDEFYGVGGSLLLIDEKSDELYVKTFIGLEKQTAKKFRMKIGHGIVGKIAKEGKPLIIVDKKYKKSAPKVKGANQYFWDFEKEYDDVRSNIISGISVPLKFKDTILGVVSITSDKHIYNNDDLKLAQIFAANIAFVYRNANLYSDLEQRIDELEIVNKLMHQVNADSNLDEIMKAVFEILSEKFDFRAGCIILDKFPELALNYYSNFNIQDKYYDKIEKDILGDVKSMLNHKLYSYNISRNIVKKGDKRFILKSGFDFVSVPIIIKKQILGFINVIHNKNNRLDQNVRFLSTIASAFAIVLENSIVYDKIEKKVSTLSTVFNVTRSISEKLDFNQVASSLTDVAKKILDARLVVLRMFDEEENTLDINRIEWAEGYKDDYVKSDILDSIELSFSRESFMKNKALYINRLYEKLRVKNIEWLMKNDLTGLFTIPLIIRGRAIGILNCYVSNNMMNGNEELELLENLCSQAAIALENSRLFSNLEKTYFDTIAALAAAIDAKDHYTHGHSEKVMEYSVAIAEEMNLSEKDVTAIRFAGLLHDVGKIGIDDNILKKPGMLTQEERKEIEKHPVYGSKIVEKVDFLRKIGSLTYHHHERWDGKGYPEGLKGDQIPIGARILSVADTFDAMTSSRSYRSALPEEVAIEEIKRCSGSQFDPKVVKSFLNVVGRKMRIKKMRLLRTEKLESLKKNK